MKRCETCDRVKCEWRIKNIEDCAECRGNEEEPKKRELPERNWNEANWTLDVG